MTRTIANVDMLHQLTETTLEVYANGKKHVVFNVESYLYDEDEMEITVVYNN